MRVKNWHKFQHFKDRRPLWVKLYRDILDDIEWHQLDGQSAKTLVMIWLVAAETAGEIPDMATLAFRLRMTEKQIETTMSKLGHWLEQSDINPISDGYQSDALEKSREEVETEVETDSKGGKPPSGVNGFPKLKADQVIELYRKWFPDAGDVAKWTPARAQTFNARLKDLPTLDEWETYFQRISKSPFLMGKVPGRNSQAPFKLSMDFVLRESTMTKVFEGYYER